MSAKSYGPSLLPPDRRRHIVERIQDAGSASVAALQAELGVSAMTIRRDLEELERVGKVRRTHGGAVLPGYAAQEDSFQHRLMVRVAEKERLAEAAVRTLSAGESVFIDSSTTGYYTARRVIGQNLRVTLLTNLLPVMALFAAGEVHNTEMIACGGSLRKPTLSFVGPQTVRMITSHFADKAFLSVKGVTPEGYLTDPDPLEAEVKRAMIEQCREPVLLLDESKFEQKGLNVVAHVSQFALILLTRAPETRLKSLTQAGARVQKV